MAAKKAKKKVVKKKTTGKKAVKKTVKKVARKAKKKITKKTSLKKPTKKVAKKSAAKKKKKPMPVAEGERCFWVYEGPVVRDLNELRDVLKCVSEEQYMHHVNKMKNDFASWIEDVLGDKETSRAVKKAKTVGGMIKAVEKSLLRYF